MSVTALLQRLTQRWWLVLVVAGGVVVWLRQHDAAIRAQVEARMAMDSLQKVTTMLVQRDSALAAERVHLQQEQEALARRRSAARMQDRIVAANTDSIRADLRASLSAQQQVQLDSVVSAYESRLAARDSAYAALQRLYDRSAAVVAASDSLLRTSRALNDTLFRRWQTALRARPSKTTDTLVKIGLFLGGVAVARAI